MASQFPSQEASLIPKPKGNAQNLREILHFTQEPRDMELFRELLVDLKSLASCHLDLTVGISEQETVRWRKFVKKACSRFPMFNKYESAWPIRTWACIHLEHRQKRLLNSSQQTLPSQTDENMHLGQEDLSQTEEKATDKSDTTLVEPYSDSGGPEAPFICLRALSQSKARNADPGPGPVRTPKTRLSSIARSRAVSKSAGRTMSPPVIFSPPSFSTPRSDSTLHIRKPTFRPGPVRVKAANPIPDRDLTPVEDFSHSQAQPVQKFLGSLIPRLDDKVSVFEEYGIRTQDHLQGLATWPADRRKEVLGAFLEEKKITKFEYDTLRFAFEDKVFV
ncbi:hypothetical protein OE88DRAFT_1653764 [Heliocybe sulcata]|uniref:Uncharacterized protein n=1 Tax=Heliocybe sulcata TaxID=5364 RepID=A0A5C3NCQ9_9AGAM|nr:hypothetical protein OE88DRAFT_1653764 [Heliocybe sulcata]